MNSIPAKGVCAMIFAGICMAIGMRFDIKYALAFFVLTCIAFGALTQ